MSSSSSTTSTRTGREAASISPQSTGAASTEALCGSKKPATRGARRRQEAGARRRTGPERMPEAPRRKPSARARRPAPPAWRDRLPALEQRHWDLIGLGTVSLAVFLALLIYLGWDGGEIGAALVDGLRRGLGAVHHVVPVALLAAGVIVVMRPVLPAVRPFRAAAACLFAGTTLGLAAGTLGVGAGPAEERGGLVGEGLLEVTSTLLG